jgi:hypothetical protein
MDADQATRHRGRGRLRKLAELWRPLPWWERVVYALAALLLSPALLALVLSYHHPIGWGEWGTPYRLGDISGLLLGVGFPFGAAAFCLAMRRWWPEDWRDFRGYWSMRAVLVGVGFFFVLGGWDSAIGLTTPLDRIRPTLPSWLAVPAFVAAGLAIVGMALTAPEVIVRKVLAKRRQP